MRHVHLITEKHVLRYLKGIVDYGLKYDVNHKINLHSYVDSDWESRTTDRKSNLWCCFSLVSGMISWISKKQSCMALTTAEEEYVSACSAIFEVLWLWKILSDLFDLQLDVTCIFYDNQSCMNISQSPMFHDKSKHIEIKFHYIRDLVQIGEVKLQYVETNELIADVLTNPLARVKFEYFKERLVVIQNETP